MGKSLKRKLLEKEVYHTTKWKKIRREIISPGKVCERCGVLLAWQLHHITSPFDTRGQNIRRELAFAVHNLEALCGPCHVEEHTKNRRCEYCGKWKENNKCNWCEAERV